MSVERIRARNDHEWFDEVITSTEVEAFCDLADAVRYVLYNRTPHSGWCRTMECICPEDVQRARAALARLDGEDTG